MSSPAELIVERRVVVCVGTGGVGKTTVAASLAVEAARRGRRALVLTIDPARRLADALGVQALGNEPVELPALRRGDLGIRGDGRLFAMMLDMKRTFDDLVDRFAEGEESKRRILGNRIYQHVSDALAGSAEYAAMEKVYELCENGVFDLIVVDTPPSQHALDFLDAPQRLLEFLDSRIVQVLLHPAFAAGRFGFRVFQRTARRVLQLVERISGVSFLEDVSEFLLAFEGMAEGFRERAHRVRALLLGEQAGFVLVAGPTAEAAANAGAFLDHLSESRVPLVGVVVNRMRLWPPGRGRDSTLPAGLAGIERAGLAGIESDAPSDEADPVADLRRLAQALAPELPRPEDALPAARAALRVAKEYASLVCLDRENTAPLIRRVERSGCFVRRVPEFRGDVHDLAGLGRIGDFLFDDREEIGTPADESPAQRA